LDACCAASSRSRGGWRDHELRRYTVCHFLSCAPYRQGRGEACTEDTHHKRDHVGAGYVRVAALEVDAPRLHQLKRVLKWHFVERAGRDTLELRGSRAELGAQPLLLLSADLIVLGGPTCGDARGQQSGSLHIVTRKLTARSYRLKAQVVLLQKLVRVLGSLRFEAVPMEANGRKRRPHAVRQMVNLCARPSRFGRT